MNSFCPTTQDCLVHVPIDEPMLQRQLQKAGYRPGHIGKWHLSLMQFDPEPTPFEYGFERRTCENVPLQ